MALKHKNMKIYNKERSDLMCSDVMKWIIEKENADFKRTEEGKEELWNKIIAQINEQKKNNKEAA